MLTLSGARNGVIVRNDMFAIDPLRVRIEKARTGAPLLERVNNLSGDPNLPTFPSSTQRERNWSSRQLQGGFTDGSWKVALATGLPSPSDDALLANRRERQRNLIALRDSIDRHHQPRRIRR